MPEHLSQPDLPRLHPAVPVLRLPLPELLLAYCLHHLPNFSVFGGNYLLIMRSSLFDVFCQSEQLHFLQHFLQQSLLPPQRVSGLLSGGILPLRFIYLFGLSVSLQHLFCRHHQQLFDLSARLLPTID